MEETQSETGSPPIENVVETSPSEEVINEVIEPEAA